MKENFNKTNKPLLRNVTVDSKWEWIYLKLLYVDVVISSMGQDNSRSRDIQDKMQHPLKKMESS